MAILTGTSGNDVLNGTAGDDLFIGSTGNDRLLGSDGFDTVDYSGLPAITLLARGVVEKGAAGQDLAVRIEKFIAPVGQANQIDASGANLAITVDLSRDALAVQAIGSFVVQNFVNVSGSQTADLIIGNSQSNAFQGNSGNDRLLGNSGNDTLDGGTGDDQIDGGEGNDLLLGGSGQDNLVGGEGDDWLDGGSGVDTLTGNAGKDTFKLTIGEFDTVTDFAVGSDKLLISGTSFGAVSLIQNGNDTLVAIDRQVSARLLNVQSAVLGQTDFSFA